MSTQPTSQNREPENAAGQDRLLRSGKCSELLPAESIALTVALAQVRRGEDPTPGMTAMCVLALARVAGRYDYTVEVS